MLDELGINHSLVVQLVNRLQALMCVSNDGAIRTVQADKYPDLRYLCHESDFAGKTTTQQLKDTLDILRDIEQELVDKGIAP